MSSFYVTQEQIHVSVMVLISIGWTHEVWME